MATVVLADNAYGTIASALAAGDTTLTFTTGHGARFPAVSSASLYCVLIDSSNVVEEIIITAHSASSDTATITRGAGSTTAKAWSAGARIEARISSSALEVAYGSTAVQTLTNKTITAPIISSGTQTSPVIITATASGMSVDNITFPAVQIASTATNVLDDYEEGAWTPVLSGTTATYSLQLGTYIKIGRSVTVQCRLVINNIGDGGAAGDIGGLPFASAASPAVRSVTLVEFSGLSQSVLWVRARIQDNTTAVGLVPMLVASTSVTGGTLLTNGSSIEFSLTYIAAT